MKKRLPFSLIYRPLADSVLISCEKERISTMLGAPVESSEMLDVDADTTAFRAVVSIDGTSHCFFSAAHVLGADSRGRFGLLDDLLPPTVRRRLSELIRERDDGATFSRRCDVLVPMNELLAFRPPVHATVRPLHEVKSVHAALTDLFTTFLRGPKPLAPRLGDALRELSVAVDDAAGLPVPRTVALVLDSLTSEPVEPDDATPRLTDAVVDLATDRDWTAAAQNLRVVRDEVIALRRR